VLNHNHDVTLKTSHTSRLHIKTWRAERGSVADIVVLVVVLFFVCFVLGLVVLFARFLVVGASGDENVVWYANRV
jgi:hypothetical protein